MGCNIIVWFWELTYLYKSEKRRDSEYWENVFVRLMKFCGDGVESGRFGIKKIKTEWLHAID